MIPIYWRFLLVQFLKVLFLSTITFVAILLTTRLDEIAHFAALGSTFWLVMRFTANQIPYILPIAIPISCLISSMLLIQRLSGSYELTALRASGLSIRRIVAPLLIAAAYLSLANFFIVSELSTDSHLFNNTIKSQLRSVNPLILLRNKNILRTRGIHFDTLGSSRVGEAANDVLFAMPARDGSGLHVVIAKGLEASSEQFSGDNVTLITHATTPDSLLIENIGSTSIAVADFAELMQKKTTKVHPDHLRWGLLRMKLDDEIKTGNRKEVNRIFTEMVRRFSVAFAAITFTIMGIAFGINISRRSSNRGIFAVMLLSAAYITCYFAAKGIDQKFVAASLFYIMPQILIVALSIFMLRRASEGIE